MAFVSAGAYAREIDLSLFVETATNTTFAFPHVFNKGPIGTPTLVTNLSRLIELFGEPIDPSVSASACQGWFAAREYLRHGNKLYITRVESAAQPAEYAAQSLPGGSDQEIATGTDGATSVPATRELSSATGDFVNDGVVAGDVVEIHEGGADDGFYLITIVAATVLTVDRDWPTGSLSAQDFTVYSSKVYAGSAGVTGTSSGRGFSHAGQNFTATVSAGDILRIHDTGDTGDNGLYVIDSVDSDTALTVDRDWPVGSLTGLDYTIYTALFKGTAGSTATDGEFTDASGKFQDHHVQEGDLLWIKDLVDTTNNGWYYITGLKTGSEDTTVEVNEVSWPGGALSNLDYEIWPGSISFQGLTKGTWIKDSLIQGLRNAGQPTNFNLETRDATGTIVLEVVYNLNRSTVVSEMTDSSNYFSATVRTNRTEPVIGKQVTVSGGDDGYTGVVDSDFIGNPATKTGLKSLRNKEQYEVNIVACPGQTSQNVQDEIIDLCESRGDCIGLVDPPDQPTVDSVQDVLDFHNGTLIRTTALNTSYAALYWSWIQVFDEFHNLDVWTAPSGHVAGVYTNNDNLQYPWYAPAGFKRGKVSGAKDLRYSPDQDDRDSLNGPGANVNPISNFIGYGIHVYGQKTLQRATTALNRVNVRRMLLFAKSAIEKAARQLVFDPNDEILWREFKQLVNPTLKHILSNRGIREYLVIADETTTTPQVAEQNKMIGKIFIKPTKAAEIIEIQFVLTSQSADFQELAA